MKQGGYYDSHSAVQAAAVAGAERLLRRAAASVKLPACDRPVAVADYGCAEGRNSLKAAQIVVSELRRRTEKDIVVYRNDLPTNDFNRLAEKLEQPAEWDTAWLGDETPPRGGRTYNALVGRSFYKQILPERSVDLGLSLSAVHWLRRVPRAAIHDDIVAHDSSGAAGALFARQAARDWRRFLTHRAAEITPGGRLVIVAVGRPRDQGAPHHAPFRLLREAALEMVARGEIAPQSFGSFILPIYLRSPEELLAPLVGTRAELRKRLIVEAAGIESRPCPHYQRFLESGDLAVYADAYTGFLRAISESSLARNLLGETDYPRVRPAGRDRINRLYSLIRDMIVDRPHASAMTSTRIQLLLRVR